MLKIYRYLICFILLSLSGCEYIAKDVAPPERHKDIPDTAVWQGGADGGAWYECSKVENDFQRFCTVYNDFDGHKEIEGIFELMYFDSNKNKIRLEAYIKNGKFESEIGYFSGSFIDFRGRILLFPLEPIFPDDAINYPDVDIEELN